MIDKICELVVDNTEFKKQVVQDVNSEILGQNAKLQAKLDIAVKALQESYDITDNPMHGKYLRNILEEIEGSSTGDGEGHSLSEGSNPSPSVSKSKKIEPLHWDNFTWNSSYESLMFKVFLQKINEIIRRLNDEKKV